MLFKFILTYIKRLNDKLIGTIELSHMQRDKYFRIVTDVIFDGINLGKRLDNKV